MHGPNARACLVQSPGDVHQTSRLTHHDCIGSAGHDAADFIFHHRAADLGIRNCERAAETAAGFLFFERNEFQTSHTVEECPGFRSESHLA